MVFYLDEVKKLIKKKEIPTNIIERLHNVFLSIDLTKDLDLFDIKRIKGTYSKEYYRLRKGKYRAIFYIKEDDIFVIYIGKREEVYDSWL
jgi:mRNA interferase RelE/StbE